MRPRHLLAACAAVTLAITPAAAAPVLTGASLSPSTWTAGGQAAVSWAQSGMEGSGVSSTAVQMNTAGDGSGAGAWLTLHEDHGPPASGPRAVVVEIPDGDGSHALRIVARDGTGVVAQAHVGLLLVDRTPPRVERARTAHTPTLTTITWAEEDEHSGIDTAAPRALEVNTSPAGDASGAWTPVPWLPSHEVSQTASIMASSLGPGAHLVRVRTADRAGNAAAATLGLAFNDQTPPHVTARLVSPPSAAGQTAQVAVAVADPAPGSGLASAVPVRIESASGATVLWSGTVPSSGETTIRVYLPGPRTYSLVARAEDRAGNTGASGRLDVVSEGPALASAGTSALAGSASPTRVAGPVARLSAPGARRVGRGAKQRSVALLTFGQTVTVRGTVTDGDGTPLRRREVEVLSAGGRRLARLATDRRGRFVANVAPERSGALRVMVRWAGAGRDRARTPVPVHAVVRPRIRVSASSRRVVAQAAPFVMSGRILPAPRVFTGAPHKRVVLEWRDPLRREWRPVVNGRAGPDGRFRLSWRFGVGGFAVPMRVRVPAELGWPLAAAVTRAVTVGVR